MKKLAVAITQAEQNDPGKFETIKDPIDGKLDRKDEDSGAVAFIWEGLKRYADFADVAFVENFITDLGHNDSDEYYFIRIGEDHNDTGERGGFYSNPFGMHMKRRVVFN